ncbi:hypothetical protein [Streptomyces sp. NBC_00557]|uniref:hypothetical protein n=1 Tax=Streptomyces sp. NBC_00557 TaxID=2975776 RepID=UPI002E7FCB8A|nr:hypothetical protein [Streptomyces sp. NBC_00557]WUC36355.1 hypothetical protein OG956_20100 [Streptomyces sp. NBC_00557]
MTAPAIPTPRDLAGRTPAVLRPAAPAPRPVPTAPPVQQAAPEPMPTAAEPKATDPTARGRLRKNEILRQVFQQGMRLSQMLPESRLLGLVLLGYADYRTGRTWRHTPTVAELSSASGLNEARVQVHLEILFQRGWLTTYTPAVGAQKKELVYQLCVPQAVLEQLRARKARPA